MRTYFEVVGTPAPQGSKTRMPNGAMLDGRSKGAREGHANWRAAVAEGARTARSRMPGTEPLAGPLALTVEFRFPMPKSRSKAIREHGRNPKTSAPDLDKLIRSTGDALKEGGLIADDALFVCTLAYKAEVVGWTGALIGVADGEQVGFHLFSGLRHDLAIESRTA